MITYSQSTKTIKMTTTLLCGCSLSISYTVTSVKSPEKFPEKVGELCLL